MLKLLFFVPEEDSTFYIKNHFNNISASFLASWGSCLNYVILIKKWCITNGSFIMNVLTVLFHVIIVFVWLWYNKMGSFVGIICCFFFLISKVPKMSKSQKFIFSIFSNWGYQINIKTLVKQHSSFSLLVLLRIGSGFSAENSGICPAP